MKLSKKIMVCILLAIAIVVDFSTYSSAAIISNKAKFNAYADDTFTLQAITIGNVIRTIGAGVSIIVIAILGIRYMLGSVEERAEYKKDIAPFLIRSYFSVWNISNS